jgi:hypothetical protein
VGDALDDDLIKGVDGCQEFGWGVGAVGGHQWAEDVVLDLGVEVGEQQAVAGEDVAIATRDAFDQPVSRSADVRLLPRRTMRAGGSSATGGIRTELRVYAVGAKVVDDPSPVMPETIRWCALDPPLEQVQGLFWPRFYAADSVAEGPLSQRPTCPELERVRALQGSAGRTHARDCAVLWVRRVASDCRCGSRNCSSAPPVDIRSSQ